MTVDDTPWSQMFTLTFKQRNCTVAMKQDKNHT